MMNPVNNKVNIPFNTNEIINNLILWIREWFELNASEDAPAVIGISGGKDSTVLAYLLAKALGPERVIGVMMPDGEQSDISDSEEVIKATGIRRIEFNIAPMTKAFEISMAKQFGWDSFTPQMDQNLPPRVRMTTLYYIAQKFGGRVVNTCNLSETWIGWETRWGDAVGDFSPLAKLTATEVIAIGEALGVPDNLIHKKPSDGLCGKTDEDKFGFTYAELDEVIRTGHCANVEAVMKIERMHRNSNFKRNPIEYYEPNLTVVGNIGRNFTKD